MRPGVRIGVDVGAVRVGVAASDPAAAVVLPVTTVTRDPGGGGGDGNGDGDGDGSLEAISGLVRERAAVEVVVGLPIGLSGREGPAALAVRRYARSLARRVAPVPVRLVDERLSTAQAVRALQPGRGRPRPRRSGGQLSGPDGRGSARGRAHLPSAELRSVVDSEAAAIILRSALATEAGTGAPPGVPVGDDEGEAGAR